MSDIQILLIKLEYKIKIITKKRKSNEPLVN